MLSPWFQKDTCKLPSIKNYRLNLDLKRSVTVRSVIGLDFPFKRRVVGISKNQCMCLFMVGKISMQSWLSKSSIFH